MTSSSSSGSPSTCQSIVDLPNCFKFQRRFSNSCVEMTMQENYDEQKKRLSVHSIGSFHGTVGKKCGQQPKMSKLVKYITTLVIFYMMLCFGMICNTTSPALVDFGNIYNSTIDTLSYQIVGNQLGYVVGALSGFLFNYINRQITATVMMAITCVALGTQPILPSLVLFLLSGPVFGFGTGVWDCTQSVWLIEMWQENCNSILQLAQCMYGAGTILGPLIDSPFLNDNSTVNVPPEETRERLITPFAIQSSFQMLGVLMLLLMFIFKRYQPPTENKEVENKEAGKKEDEKVLKLFDHPESPRKTAIAMIALCLACYNACEITHFGYVATLAQKLPFEMSGKQAAKVQSAMAASFTICRALNALVALKLKPRQMMINQYTLLLISHVLLIFSQHSVPFFWVANILVGAGFSGMWPSIFAFADRYLNFDNLASTALVSSSGLTCVFSMLVIGKLIQQHPMMMIYLDLGLVIASLSVYMVITVLIKNQKLSLKEKQLSSSNGVLASPKSTVLVVRM